jgi:Fe-S-cluster-containing hydrogenase component 2
MIDDKIIKDDKKCIGCRRGVMICPTNAIKFKT